MTDSQHLKRAQQILKRHAMRKTLAREEALALFLSKPHALSHSEIEESLSGRFDRVTLYRTLKTFEDQGLIHRVIDDGAVVKYAACSEACDEHVHHDNHVHFKCQQCQQTFCLHEVPIQSFPMPPGFVPNDYQLLISGTCPSCAPSA